MYIELFQELGLSPNEAKIYEALLTYGGSGVSTISLRSGVHRRNAYDTLHRLIEKGMVSEVFSSGETVYEAVEPGKLMEFIKEKESRLQQALPALSALHHEERAVQQAFIYKGIEGFKNYLRDALKTGEDMYFVAAKGGWFDPRLDTFIQWFLKEMNKKKMKNYLLYDEEMKTKVSEHFSLEKYRNYKFIPKKYRTNSAIDIFGDHIVTFTGLGINKLEDDVTVFVIVSPRLAESYRIWWQMMWDLLPSERQKRVIRPKKKRT